MSRSNFGSHDTSGALRIRAALRILHQRAPDLEADGEMHADAALSESIRNYSLPGSTLKGQANLLVMPNVEAANIAFNLLKMLGGGVTLGPILLGASKPAHVVTQAITVRGLVNMTALTVAQADAHAEK
jgi:malate dehydrogenase (oxaloacetate-decarboxylating)(NADP+)